MKNLLAAGIALFLMSCSSTKNSSSMTSQADNTLSEKETKEGWQLLFDGSSVSNWHSYGKPAAGKSWVVADNSIYLDTTAKNDWQTSEGGDILTAEEYGNFHLKLDWKIAKDGNSGVMFYIKEDSVKYQYPWYTGPEMQVLDNNGHPDAKIVKHRAGDLYDLIVSKETVKPAGEWNHAEVIADKGSLKFYLNGENTLTTTMWDDNWKTLVAGSKFKERSDFGSFKEGKIALQDHGNAVWFKNIKIKKL
ncbi:MAG: DUF1080 domain-containing protein [Ginsengibacter sp.]